VSFGNPIWLLGLLALPVLVALLVARRQRRQRYAVRFTGVSNLKLAAAAAGPSFRRYIPTALVLAALALLTLALARPQRTIAVPVGKASVMLVTDTSGSMNATDVSPTRLAAAQASAKRFLDKVPDQLQVGLHCIGFVGNTTHEAADDFYPGWAQMFGTIGKERGFRPPDRAQYDAMCAPDGAYLIGDPQTVASKILRINDDLGGISRISLQMTNVRLAHENLLRAIEQLGTGVAPIVRNAIPD